MLKNLILGDAGLRHVLDVLKEEGGKLSELGGRIISSLGGTCFAPVPEHVTLGRALEFEMGGLLSSGVVLDWIEDRMLSFCTTCEHGLLVFEDQVLRRGDKGVSDSLANVFYVQDQVYFFVECQDATATKIETASREVRSFRSISFLIRTHAGELLKKGCTVDIPKLNEMAENIVTVVISAYDREGVVVWSRPEWAGGTQWSHQCS